MKYATFEAYFFVHLHNSQKKKGSKMAAAITKKFGVKKTTGLSGSDVKSLKPPSYRDEDYGELKILARPLFQMLGSLDHFCQGAQKAYVECQNHIRRWNQARLQLLKKKMYEANLGWCTLCEHMFSTKVCNGENYISGTFVLIREWVDYRDSVKGIIRKEHELHTACKNCANTWLAKNVTHTSARTRKELLVYAYDMVTIGPDNIVRCYNADDPSKRFPFNLFVVVEMEECHITRGMEKQFGIPAAFELFENHMAAFESGVKESSVAYFQFQVGAKLFDLES